MPHVLVVDDSLSVRKALEKILTPRLTVSSAVSGEDARSQLEGLAPDLVIADVLMPGISGFELCRELKDSARHGGVPVLLISGIVDDAVRAQAEEAGALGVIRKPFTPGDLLPVVEEALAAAPPRPQAASEHTVVASVPPAAPLSDPNPLLAELLTKPGVSGAVIFDRAGAVVAARGQTDTLGALGHYLRFYTATAAVLGGRLEAGALHALQLEYDRQTLLAVPLDAAHVLACLVQDAASVGMVKFMLRRQGQLHA